MPNTSVRAAAEGMPSYPQETRLKAFFRKLPVRWFSRAGSKPTVSKPELETFMNQHVDRRGLLASSAIATVALAAAVTRTQEANASEVQEAIAACQRAEEDYGVCVARENAIVEALDYEIYPKWTPPGGAASIWSHRPVEYRTAAALQIEIARKAEWIEASFAAGLMNRAAFDRQTRDLADQGGEGLASLQGQEAVIAASGYLEAVEAVDKVMDRFSEAWGVLLRLPCKTIGDVRAKASCLLRSYEQMGWAVDGEEVVALLASLSVSSEAQ